MDSFGPFAVGLLDKFEGVLGGDLLDPRRYADHLGMHCLLESCGLQALVVDGSGVTMEACERLSRVQPGGATWAEAVPELRGGALDMVFARYDTPGWQHYRSVHFLGGGAWRISDEARARVAARFGACDVCQALVAGDVGLARGLMLSLLGPPYGVASSAGVVRLESAGCRAHAGLAARAVLARGGGSAVRAGGLHLLLGVGAGAGVRARHFGACRFFCTV